MAAESFFRVIADARRRTCGLRSAIAVTLMHKTTPGVMFDFRVYWITAHGWRIVSLLTLISRFLLNGAGHRFGAVDFQLDGIIRTNKRGNHRRPAARGSLAK